MSKLGQIGLHSPTRVRNFLDWLSANGAQILKKTNPYEIVRFKAGGLTSIIYKNESGKRITFVGQAEEAYESFTSAESWRAQPLLKGKRPSVAMQTVRTRDGDLCFFCQKEVADDGSLEHLVAVTHNGPEHISNMFLAHKLCNQKAGHLSAPEKIKIHVKTVKVREEKK